MAFTTFTSFLIVFLIIPSFPYRILNHILYKKYKKTKEESHYITSTKMGINKSRLIFVLIWEIVVASFGIYLLINLNHLNYEILSLFLIFMLIAQSMRNSILHLEMSMFIEKGLQYIQKYSN